MDKKQPVHEGYLQWLPPAAGVLQVQFCQLSWSSQLRMFAPESTASHGAGATTYSVRGFCQWEGLGVLPLDSYGLELQLKDKRSLYVAAENRLDLERWCRALIAVLDPTSEAANEIKRERRKVKREIRKQHEKEQEIKDREEARKRQWVAQKKQELLDREREIEEMTPLQRKDGLGTLDEETEKLLRERKKRLNKKVAQGRVGKEAQRRRLEMMAGGKSLDATVPPLLPDAVPRKSKFRFDLPPPGQYFVSTKDPKPLRDASTGSVSSQDSVVNDDDASVSGVSEENVVVTTKLRGGFVPPPPPPPKQTPASTDFVSRPTNPMAAALDAIKRNRKYSVDSERPSRSRQSQLSAEGKELLTRALSSNKLHPERKGLFDSSDDDDDHDDDTDALVSRQSIKAHKIVPTVGTKSVSGDDEENEEMSAARAIEHAPSNVPAVLSVGYVASAVETRGGKTMAIYTFEFRLHTWCRRLGLAFHELEAMHQTLKAHSATLPKFPSKHVLRNPTKPDLMQKRAVEITQYLQGLLAVPGLVQHTAFHSTFAFPPEWASSLLAGVVTVTATTASFQAPTRATKVSSRNLFDDASSDDDDEVSIVSVETEPVFNATKITRPASQRSELPVAQPPQRRPSHREILASAPNALSTAPSPTQPRPSPFGGAGRGDLLAAIRMGAHLKSVDGNQPPAPTVNNAAPSSRPVAALPTPIPVAPRPPLATAPSIHDSIANAMASRLNVTQYDDADDDDSDWDD
ncbi:hypothetical protein SDRG_16672 [Saprolegnia diclina VS20]|uniref:PX domain-containing protein n=1 Tax=Saprolegnia diclina (strain VS20) TaxID=1156394 RepID=T0R0H6_SAPDV|nr:hypothetical protein SDRG_16672 [Saprolegnia diclina VS20]EQC25453.1 hypothetical protein SDRG_16672 [Saprolegnia diclina VS20]|eukprot:XP_008621112.1 hypothetical protein SDRG_16672 [Saprolegnia diclina VS20]